MDNTKKSGASNVGNTKMRRNNANKSVDSQSKTRKTLYGGASRTLLSSAGKKNVSVSALSEKTAAPIKVPVQVIDEEGKDVTPQPLLRIDPAVFRKNQNNILADSTAPTPTDFMSQASIYQTGTVNASTFGGGPFTRSVFSASQSGQSNDSLADELLEPSNDLTTGLDDIKHKREDAGEDIKDLDFDKEIHIVLTETETFSLIELPSICVSQDTDEAGEVRDQNERYAQLVKSRAGNDRYAERGMNTFNEPPKVKASQTHKIGYVDIGISADTWDMYDTYENLEKKADIIEMANKNLDVTPQVSAEKVDVGSETERRSATVTSQERSTLESRGTEFSFAGQESRAPVKTDAEDKIDEKDIMSSTNLLNHLVILERAVNLNSYQPKQASYRGLENVIDIDTIKEDDDLLVKRPDPVGPHLDRLWGYVCPFTKGRNVSSIVWNKMNPDLLAVGYGQFEFTGQKSGLVCCWSLKNPEYPERIYFCPAGVTSMDFSRSHPNLLAVGLYDGSVAIYNVKNRKDETVLDSVEAAGKHTGPVWQLRWIEKDRGSGEDRTEVLVSTSQDGRVTQWSIRKGFESLDLMKLKRVSTKQGPGKAKKTEAFISRYAGGMCLDFSLRDSNIYLAGTDEGHIHRCSCSYNEQYLDSYLSHQGPVYSIQWSPFIGDIFLSCSSDWSVKMWHIDHLRPILTFHATNEAVPGICWSPRSSTVFACVSEGTLEVWDLSQSTLDPIIKTTPVQGAKLSTIVFAKNSDSLLVGDSSGQISVYELKGMPTPNSTQVEADMLKKVVNTSLASQLNKH